MDAINTPAHAGGTDLSRRLKLDPESDLPFASGQHLRSRADRICRNVLLRKDRGWVLTVQQIKELEKEIHIYPFADVETLGKAHIEIDEGRRGEGIPPGSGSKISADDSPVTVGIHKGCSITAETKAALRPEDPADLKLIGEIHQPVDLEDMFHRQIGRPLIKVRAI